MFNSSFKSSTIKYIACNIIPRTIITVLVVYFKMQRITFEKIILLFNCIVTIISKFILLYITILWKKRRVKSDKKSNYMLNAMRYEIDDRRSLSVCCQKEVLTGLNNVCRHLEVGLYCAVYTETAKRVWSKRVNCVIYAQLQLSYTA